MNIYYRCIKFKLYSKLLDKDKAYVKAWCMVNSLIDFEQNLDGN